MSYLIESLEIADNPIVLFRGIVGSRAYGTQNANSDTDVRGIFVVPSAEYARLAQPPKQVSDERNDRTYYSLVRFCELMAEANPTTMEMLFLPDDCILKRAQDLPICWRTDTIRLPHIFGAGVVCRATHAQSLKRCLGAM